MARNNVRKKTRVNYAEMDKFGSDASEENLAKPSKTRTSSSPSKSKEKKRKPLKTRASSSPSESKEKKRKSDSPNTEVGGELTRDNFVPAKSSKLRLGAKKSKKETKASSPAAQKAVELSEKKCDASAEKKSRLTLKKGQPTIAKMFEKSSENTQQPPAKKINQNLAVASLHNLGNTCYANSVLQVLRYTPNFVDHLSKLRDEIIQSDTDQRRIGSAQEETPGWDLVRHINQLFVDMKHREKLFAKKETEFIALRPYSIIHTLEKVNPLFEEGAQQDAHEFLQCILTCMQDACHAINAFRSKYKPLAQVDGTSDEVSITDVNKRSRSLSRESCDKEEQKTKKRSLGMMSRTLKLIKTSEKEEKAHGKSKEVNDTQKTSEIQKEIDMNHNQAPDSIENTETGTQLQGTVKKFNGNGIHRPQKARKSFKVLEKAARKSTLSVTVYKMPELPETGICREESQHYCQPVTDEVADLVEAMFQGTMAHRTKCLTCEVLTERTEKYQAIGVAIQKTQSDDSDDEDSESETDWLVSAIHQEEYLRDDNKYRCEHCLRLEEARRSLEYITVPPILVLHQFRFAMFSAEAGVFSKISEYRPTPRELPCLLDKCKSSCTQHSQELYAVIMHTGATLSSGHYTAYIKAPSDLKASSNLVDCIQNPGGDNTAETYWLECDDEYVDLLTSDQMTKVLSPGAPSTPYLLFYH